MVSDPNVFQKDQALKSILYSLKSEIERELSENSLDKCLIDTSPFFAGATQLAWYAADALVIPVRTDQQSIKSLELLINTLSSPQSEFRKYLPETDMNVPKIQMVVLTHCGWSTVAGARNEPNQQTKVYLKKVYDILSKHIRKKCQIFSDMPSLYLYITMNKQKKHIGDISLNQYVPFLAKPYFGSDLTTIIYLILYQKSTSVP